MSGDWVTIATVGGTRGNRGELFAFPLTGHPERFETLDEVFLFGDGARFRVENAWWHGNRLVLKFEGVDSISEAEALAGCEVRVPAAAAIELEPGEYFQSDLVGCEVFDRDSGERLGAVHQFVEGGGSGLLDLGGGLLIPFARSICVEIDPARKRIVVAPPDGLLELNRP